MPLAVDLSSSDREELTSWVRCSSVRAGLAQRARIVLLAAGGVPVTRHTGLQPASSLAIRDLVSV